MGAGVGADGAMIGAGGGGGGGGVGASTATGGGGGGTGIAAGGGAGASAAGCGGGAGLAGGGVAGLLNGDVFDHCTLLMFWKVPVARKPRKPSGRFPSCAVKSMIVRNFSELRSILSLSLKRM
jgi:hypothetical protein